MVVRSIVRRSEACIQIQLKVECVAEAVMLAGMGVGSEVSLAIGDVWIKRSSAYQLLVRVLGEQGFQRHGGSGGTLVGFRV